MLFILKYLDLFFFGGALLLLVWLFFKQRRALYAETGTRLLSTNLTSLGSKFGGILAALIIVIGGLLVTKEAVNEQENIVKQHLRNNTLNLAHSFHAEHIEKLTFTADDVESPYFQRISEQIKNYFYYSGIQGIYTIKERGGDFFFGPESFMPDDSLYREIGSRYLNPPPELKKVFEEQVTLITRSSTSRGGDFVSCFAPMFNIDKSEVLMVLGVDVNQKDWEYQINKVKILPIVVSLSLLILILGGFRLIQIRNKRSRQFSKEKFHYWEGIWVFCASLVITIYSVISEINEEKTFQYGVFSQVVSSEGESISGALDMVRHTLYGSAQLFSSSDSVSQIEFGSYVDYLLSYPMVSSVGWVRQEPGKGFFVEYELPSDNLLFEKGQYVVSEDKLRFGAVLETLYTGFISSTMSYMKDGQERIDLFLRTEDNAGNSCGFVFLSLDLGKLEDIFSVGNSVQNNFFSSNVRLVDYRSRSNEDKINFFSLVENQKKGLTLHLLEFFYGKTFAISISAEQGFFKSYRKREYQANLFFGLIISLFLSGLVMIMSNRRLILEKQVEKQASDLKFSEERFRSLFSNMLEGVAFNEMIFDDEGKPVNYRFLEINKAYESLIGVKREETVGKDAIELFDRVPSYFEKYCQVVQEQKAVVFETYSKEHGKFLKLSAAPWGTNGFATIFSDITLRKKAEARLKKSEERYRLISENAEDLIWLYNPHLEQFVYVSPSVKKLTGKDYLEIVGKGFNEVLMEESGRELKQLMPLRLARFGMGDESMRVIRSQVDVKTETGEPLPMEMVTTLLLDENNGVPWVLGVGRDISDRVKAETALKMSEEKYRLLVENQNDLVVKIDWEGYLTYVSPSYCKMFGKSEEELLNTKFMPLVHPQDQASTAQQIKKLSNPPHHVMLEQRAMTNEGWKWLSWNDTAVLSQEGSIIEIIGVGRDITERKMAEKALHESRELLERQNEEYAALNEEYLTMNEELTRINEDLSLAIERAEESEKLKTAFLQNMSHEIRTPLNAVIGFSEMLGMDYITDIDRKEFTKIIVNSSRQLLELVNDILTISAIETRQDKVTVSPVNIGGLVSELYSVFRSKAKDKGILLEIRKGVDDEKAVIMTDELKLRQIFINLLGNALKFTEEGSIEMGFEAQEDAYYRFFVKDTGIGVSKQMKKRIFERFVQADSSVKGQYGGTGLGLAICKGHVELLGGEIWLESTPGVGSVFYFTLPVMPE
ncbi:PAS domain-containing hybrid sensor histidine kinase/response regulator [Marinilabilia sp.]|uniref:PAS domain-containing hybrid sensor histidine kinase/response regulator n=1 Tax=Marinilabilia sp. TaxID=2021252 RepID=UPI0025C1CDE0|nr:PAS domain-containing hybrid sensor histidine kinase/response regulator [Marinilabilia sp.]